jgi:hypothetical protein
MRPVTPQITAIRPTMMAHKAKAGPAEYNVADPMIGSFRVVCIVFIPIDDTAAGVDQRWGSFWRAKVTAITAEAKRCAGA